MAQGGKILVTEQGSFDLSSYRWDDHLFSDLLVRENEIDGDRAMTISRSLREEIGKLETQTITIPLLEKIIETKLLEYGLKKPSRWHPSSDISSPEPFWRFQRAGVPL